MATVAVLGGGVAGLTTAHELAERGFDVTVFEMRNEPGGKARSYPKPGTGTGGRQDLPGEHGFRFFPGFYKHLPDTMRRIPFTPPGAAVPQPDGVFGNLVTASRSLYAAKGKPGIVVPSHFPDSLRDVIATLTAQIDFARLGIPPAEGLFFLERVLTFLSSCDERRLGQFEKEDWWDFVGAETRSPAYQKFLGGGLIQNFVACRPRLVSARTAGTIGTQLMFDMTTPGLMVDRLLNGPTQEAWIAPWMTYLNTLGVAYNGQSVVTTINYNTGAKTIDSVTVRDSAGVTTSPAFDYFVAAFPLETTYKLTQGQMQTEEPVLAGLKNLRVARMNGIQFYLLHDVPIVHGHVALTDSPWALTAISQAQFWVDPIAATFGDGTVNGILSVIISDWYNDCYCGVAPLRASQCNADQIEFHVWHQLTDELNTNPARPLLTDANLAGWYIDRDVVPSPPVQSLGDYVAAIAAAAGNLDLEPLLINVKDTWQYRPDAVLPNIANLFLAADYIRTYTDLATMEGANEAARRAVNGLLDAAGSGASRCKLWPLDEPAIFKPLREWDKALYNAGYVGPLASPPAILASSVAGSLLSLLSWPFSFIPNP